jgi:hypothetical protein
MASKRKKISAALSYAYTDFLIRELKTPRDLSHSFTMTRKDQSLACPAIWVDSWQL